MASVAVTAGSSCFAKSGKKRPWRKIIARMAGFFFELRNEDKQATI